uniref:Uncharacterized protein n=1 Tax=Zosterops lateralis melanops TaxID=1220523 RepID=A0A8D2PD13_ZOSLA
MLLFSWLEAVFSKLVFFVVFSFFLLRQLMANEPLEKLGFKDLIKEKSEEKPEKS